MKKKFNIHTVLKLVLASLIVLFYSCSSDDGGVAEPDTKPTPPVANAPTGPPGVTGATGMTGDLNGTIGRRNVTFLDPTFTTTVTLEIKSGETFRQALIRSVNEAGTGGVISIPDGIYETDIAIVLPTIEDVVIQGSGKDNVTINAIGSFDTNVQGSRGVIAAGANKTTFKGISVDRKGLNTRRGAVISSNGFSDVKAYNVRFSNSKFGFGTPNNGRGFANGSGLPINGLVAQNCEFINCERGIAFNRAFSINKTKSITGMRVEGCQFKGTQSIGITLDCGNDGSDGTLDQRNLIEAPEAKLTITDFNGMVIKGCTFEKAVLFNVAFAKAENILVEDNLFLGNTAKDGTKDNKFARSLNLEHESNNVMISNNTFMSDPTTIQQSHISLFTFRDYKNPALFENGVNNITILKNEFQGQRTTIGGEEASDILIKDNRFNSPRATLREVNLFKLVNGEFNKNTQGNKNIMFEGNIVETDDGPITLDLNSDTVVIAPFVAQ